MDEERKRIGLREIKALAAGGVIYDSAVSGFGARRQNSDAVSYFVLYRTAEGRQRWHTIGRHGSPWTPDLAREEAKSILGLVVKGADPAADKREKRNSATVAELCDRYMADAEAGRLLTRRGVAKKSSTLQTDRSRIDSHIRPLLGAMKVAAVSQRDVERFMHDVAKGKTAHRVKTDRKYALSNIRGGKGAASRTVGLLGGIFTYAIKRGMRSDNPVTGTVRYADGQRVRRLTAEEYGMLGRGLTSLNATIWPYAGAAARFLALTGWRSGEVINLRSGDVDLAKRTARLTDTKTGISVRALSKPACDELRDIGIGKANELVFRASRGEGPMSGLPGYFARIVAAAGLGHDVTPHVLRHSFVSLANDLGFTEATIGMLVGHKSNSTTRGYIHGADDVLLAAADRIAGEISDYLGQLRTGLGPASCNP